MNPNAMPTPLSLKKKVDTVLVKQQFVRKPFVVEAVQLTNENFPLVLEWTKGTEEKTKEGRRYVEVDVLRPLHERQQRAYVGDWVLFSATGFKIYTESAFERCFMEFVVPDGLTAF